MKASVFYRIAAVLLLLFALGHTLGFRQSDPSWGVDALVGSMRSIHFEIQGSAAAIGTFLWRPDFLSECFIYSQRYWRGSWAASQRRLWRSCAALHGPSPFALR